MSLVADITPVVLSYNEVPNIERVLNALSWARQVLVVDSFSTDGTQEILRRYPAVRVVERAFDSHTHQWNFAIGQVKTEWVLALDADYVVTSSFVDELGEAVARADISGYHARFRYWLAGRPLTGSLYPPRIVLFRRSRGRYVEDGHTQRLEIVGPVGWMHGHIAHDDRKPIARWLEAQSRYALLERAKLLTSPSRELSRNDRVRVTTLWAPILAFFHCLFVRGGILDGRRGLYYALQRLYAEALIALHIHEVDMQLPASPAPGGEASPLRPRPRPSAEIT